MFENRLIHEKSPYLLQHAHNPVDWYPWGDEAFAAAKQSEKPIFLSIGYATCHWCHVMERESFTDVEIAKLLNETFVNVKVDREELPHIDNLYMEFAQALMSSAGGWPLNVILTPDLKPIIALTYLPPKARKGLMGLDQLILQIKELWDGGEREELVAQAANIVQAFASAIRARGEILPDSALLDEAIERLFILGDPISGGIKGEPKFPLSYSVELLLQYTKLKRESRALYFAETTLTQMRRGGIYDHLGGGFSRYCIDAKWLVPHFEKTLYDNALLAKAYLEGWKYTQKDEYRQVVIETLDFFLREMSYPEGGFFSAQDADSDGKEGVYYTWTLSEIFEALDEEEAEVFTLFYGATQSGNFHGRNILHIPFEMKDLAQQYNLAPADLEKFLKGAKQKLLKKRQERTAPLKDDKVIVGWNGFMIDALARAGSALDRTDYTEAAVRTARFLRAKLWREGRLVRRFRDGEARFAATLEDYSFLIKGLLTLFEEGNGSEWLAWALELAEILEREFKAAEGAFYQTSEQETVLVRICDFYDGAEPSGNGVHAENLVRLYQLTGEEGYMTAAEDIFKAARAYMENYPPGNSYHLLALQRYLDSKSPTVIIAAAENAQIDPVRRSLATHFSLHLSKAWRFAKDAQFDKLLSAHADKRGEQGKTTLYICRSQVCETPISDANEFEKAINTL